MFKDNGHRPHARHTGETPRNEIKAAPYHLSVTLDTWGPVNNLFPVLYDALQSNWGDAPSRTVNEPMSNWVVGKDRDDTKLANDTGWSRLTDGQRAYVEAAFKGETLQQAFEKVTFAFTIDGCTRASTHQIVRTRLGAAFMQHGGRDNDWRHRPWVMPETIRRACEFREGSFGVGEIPDTLKHCITDWNAISKVVDSEFAAQVADKTEPTLTDVIAGYLKLGRDLYAALVDAGIPWEDARRLLWMGTSTYIHADYNYLGLRGLLSNRLEHIMDWEINCIAQLMRREVIMHCPPIFGKYLVSASDRAGKAMFAGLESWPPDGKYPNPFERCAECHHAKENHTKGHEFSNIPDRTVCEVCLRDNAGLDLKGRVPSVHEYVGVDSLPREHRPEQNPFFILAPESMAGGPIRWIATNGSYPEELKPSFGRE